MRRPAAADKEGFDLAADAARVPRLLTQVRKLRSYSCTRNTRLNRRVVLEIHSVVWSVLRLTRLTRLAHLSCGRPRLPPLPCLTLSHSLGHGAGGDGRIQADRRHLGRGDGQCSHAFIIDRVRSRRRRGRRREPDSTYTCVVVVVVVVVV